jgi:hypothetical protein
MGPRLSSPPPLRSRYVRSDTRDEKDMLCYVLWFGAGELLVGEKDDLQQLAEMVRANVTIIVLSRGPGSRGREDKSIDGSYGEGMEEAYQYFKGEEITDVRFKKDAGEATGNYFVILSHGTPRVIVHLNLRLPRPIASFALVRTAIPAGIRLATPLWPT